MNRLITMSNGHVIATEAWLRKPARPDARRAVPRRQSAMSRLLAGISTGAAALVMLAGPAPVRAQAVIGAPTIQFGIEIVDRSVLNTDVVNVNSSEALLDWTSTSSTGVFLPQGGTLRFQGNSEGYTVLNRVTSSVAGGPLSISGLVESGSNGNVWFYSPGGWVVGATGVFNVGSLVMTSLPITVDGDSDQVSRLFGDNGEIRFGAATVPGSSVSISGQARINADLRSGSYVALVAPKVSQAGTVRVDGSAAYVAAEAATMTINNGLFDIVVDTGSTDSTGISHTGSTGGPASNLSEPEHQIYLVAVPKNQAMTAVVSGSLGYEAAITAEGQADGSIILSAGHNIIAGSVASDTVAGANASLSLTGLTASNGVTGFASGKIGLSATAADIDLQKGAFLTARGDIDVTVTGSHELQSGATLDLQSKDELASGAIKVTIGAGSTFDVDGDFSAQSIAQGLVLIDPENGDALLADSVGTNATSGNVSVSVRNADFTVGGATYLRSTAAGGVGALSYGSATAGDVSFAALQNNTGAPNITVSLGDVELTSSAGSSPVTVAGLPLAGSAAQSGSVTFSVNGGYASVNNASVSTIAQAGSGSVASPQTATTGDATISFVNDIEGFSAARLLADNSAASDLGGNIVQGDVSLSLDNAYVTVGSAASGYIGLTSSANGTLLVPNTIDLSLTNQSVLDLDQGYMSLSASGSDAIGTQTGSNLGISIDNSELYASDVYAYTSAYGGQAGNSGQSGNVSLSVTNNAILDLQGSIYLDTTGFGGFGTDGGDGVGGDIDITLDNGTVDVSYISASSIGTAGQRNDAAGRSGTGTGGITSFSQSGSLSSFTTGGFVAESLGVGGRGGEDRSSARSSGSQAGDGAAGVGGTTSFEITAGEFSATDLTVRTDGEGSSGYSVEGSGPAKGGSGSGGNASFSQTGGTATINSLRVIASGIGGDGADLDGFLDIDGGDGGSGTGGLASASLTGGTLNADTVLVEANGNKSIDFGSGFVSYAGNGGRLFYDGGSAGNGGNGQGGNAELTVDGGALLDAEDSNASLLSVTVNAIGEGGAGGATYLEGGEAPANSGSGGNGSGGSAIARFLSGTFDATQLTVAGNGIGGLSGNIAQDLSLLADSAGAGGSGSGGSATFEIGTDFGTLTSSDDTRIITISATGFGQSGEGGRVGGAGGTGTGGSATITATGGTVNLSGSLVTVTGSGGNGGIGQNDGDGGAGGSGTGGSVSVLADGDGTELNLVNHGLTAGGRAGNGGNGGSGKQALNGAGNGGAGGAGQGGTIDYVASNAALLNVTGQVNSESDDLAGVGGDGGLGGNSAASGFTSTGDGGAGGAGTGGSFVGRSDSGGELTFDDVSLQIYGFGGAGSGLTIVSGNAVVQTSNGGAGGAGTGGSISLISSGSESDLSVTSLNILSSGVGGSGAAGRGVNSSGDGAAGGVGGDGLGGEISIMANDLGTITIAPDADRIDLVSNGQGGAGGRGFGARAGTGGDGGAGGTGGLGQGGSIALAGNSAGVANIANSGLTFIQASGFGGTGGLGGNGASTTVALAVGGNGGDSGIAAPGIGGTIDIGATGGQLTLGSLDIEARGVTSIGATVAGPGKGPGGRGTQGQRNFALPFGGDVSFASADDEGGNTGSLQIGQTTVVSTSDFTLPGVVFPGAAGLVELNAQSSLESGGLRFASLTVDATGQPFEGSAIVVNAISGPIEVDTDLVLQAAGPISLTTNGSAGVLVGGNASITSDTGIAITGNNGGQLDASSISLNTFGTINISSVDCPDAACAPVHASGSLTAMTSGDFNLIGPAFVAGLGSVDVYAGVTITGEDGSGYFSNGDVQVRGLNDVTVRNATGGNVHVEAGAVVDGSTQYFPATLTLGNVEGGGQFNSTSTFVGGEGGRQLSGGGSFTFVSGGGIAVTDNNTFSATGGIEFISGNDIVVGAGNSISANVGALSEPAPISFLAGGLEISYELGTGDIAALSLGGGTSVDAGLGLITLSGAAIDARLATFSGGSLIADVTRALALGDPRSDDGERLDPSCLEGAICIGDVTTSDDIAVGLGDALPLDVLATGTLAGRVVTISSLGDTVVGPAAQVLAENEARLTSSQGGITLGEGSLVRGGTVALSGAGSLSGSGSLEATVDDVGLTFGGDIDAASITAFGELTSAEQVGGFAEGSFRAPGSLRVGTLVVGTDADIGAATDLTIGTLSVGGNSAVLSAGRVLDLGATQNVFNLALSAPTVTFGSLSIGGELLIDGGTVTGASAIAGGTLGIDADNLSASLLQSGGDLDLTVVNTAALGTVRSTGGSVAIDPVLLTFEAIAAATSVTLEGGTITGGTVNAGTGIDITATGALTLTSATAGAGMSLTAASVIAPTLSAVGNIAITSTGIAQLGTATAGQALSIDADTLQFAALNGGTVRLDATSATGGSIVGTAAVALTSSGALTLTSATSGAGMTIAAGSLTAPTLSAADNLTITSTGAVQLGSATAGQGLSVDAGDLRFDALDGGTVGVRSGSITGGSVRSGGAATITATGDLALTTVDAELAIALTGTNVAATGLTAGSGISVIATEAASVGAVSGESFTSTSGSLAYDTIDTRADTSITATGPAGSVSGGAITSGAAIAISAGDSVTVGALSATGNIGLDTGALTLTSATAGQALTIDARDLRFDALDGGTVGVLATSATGGTVRGTGSVALTTAGALALTSATSGAGMTIAAGSLTVPALSAVGNLSVTTAGVATLGTATAGQALSIDAGDLRFDRLTGGTVGVRGGSVTGGSVRSNGAVSVAATRALALTTVDAVGAIALSGSGVATGALTAGAGITLNAAGAASVGTVSANTTFRSTTGSLAYSSITTRGDTTIAATGSVSGGNVTSGGGIGIVATGPVAVGVLSATGNIALDGGALSYTSATAGGRLDIDAASVAGGAVIAGTDVRISSDADLTLASLAGRAVTLGSGGSVNVASLTASGAVSVSADAVSLTSPGALQISSISASNGNAEVIAAGSITGQTIDARGDVLLRSTASDVIVTRVTAGYANASGSSVRPQANAVSGVIGQGDILIEAARDVRIDTLADAANAFTANAGRNIALNGLATGRTMALSSTDIAIGATAQLGETSHTTSIGLRNSGQSVTLLGDNLGTQTTGYALSQAEFARIRSSGTLQIGGGTALRVGDLAAVAQAGTVGGQIGETGQLLLNSQGPVSFVGAVTLSNAAGNTLVASSGQGLFLDAATGSIRLLEGQTRAGTLSLSGQGIAMVTSQALQDLANLTDTGLITERLSRNDGVTADRMLIEADTISLRSDRNIYIQNTAASADFDARRGLAAGNLSINSRDGGTLDVVINGTVGGATGIDAIAMISFDEDLTRLSSVNGCVIASADACGVEPIVEEPLNLINVRDVIEEVLANGSDEGALPVVDSFTRSVLIQFNQITPPGFEPLIDEPVTGTGNDDMLGEEERTSGSEANDLTACEGAGQRPATCPSQSTNPQR